MILITLHNHQNSRVEYNDGHFDNTLMTREHCLATENVACLRKRQKTLGLLTHYRPILFLKKLI